MEMERNIPWHEIIRQERLQTDHELISWEAVSEGAIVSVSQGPSCAGVWVYMFGGPDKPTEYPQLPYMDMVDYFKSDHFPQLRSYHSCPSKDQYDEVRTEPEYWIEQGKEFVNAVRELPRE